MRLLHTKTGRFHEITDPSQVRYAILSHVWSTSGEMSYQDVERIRLEQGILTVDNPEDSPSLLPHLSDKIHHACTLASSEGFSYIWIDTCCIDKSSSAELSEAINSMYAWYAQSTLCYAHLEDAELYDNGTPHTVSSRVRLAQPSISGCRWFTRAWTLQELIAPAYVVFVGPEWVPIGTKDSYAEVITSITRVPGDVLRHIVSADAYSVAVRMSWASCRHSSRLEDEAYSLMGIFGVHMSPIYGEGKNAFRRLQQEILKQDPDQSILAWGSAEVFSSWPAFVAHAGNVSDAVSTTHDTLSLRDPLSATPESFGRSAALLGGTLRSITPQQLAQHLAKPWDEEAPWPDIAVTPVGIHTRAPIMLLPSGRSSASPLYVAFLACEYHSSDVAGPLLPVLLLTPMDAQRAGITGAKKARTAGRIHFYIAGNLCFVPVAVTTPRFSAHVFSWFEDICIGFPHALGLKRYHSVLGDHKAAVQRTDTRGIISPDFRLSLTPQAGDEWAHYRLFQSSMLSGGQWSDGPHTHKLPPTHTFVFVPETDNHDRIIIRLGPCTDDAHFSNDPPLPSPLTACSPDSARIFIPGTAVRSSATRPLRVIISRTCSVRHNEQCVLPTECEAASTRPTNLEAHTEHVVSWTQVDGCFTRNFVVGCSPDPIFRVVVLRLTIQPWWPSGHPSAYSDTYRLGVDFDPQ